jgi:hypothetical protein
MNTENKYMNGNEELTQRLTPSIRESSVMEAPETPVKVKKLPSQIDAMSVNKNHVKIGLLMLVSALVGSLLTFAVTSNSPAALKASESNFTDVIAGKVVLTEKELIDAVQQLGIDVFWAGPVDGAKYTLSVPVDGQAFVRYLPDGDGLEDTNPNYVVIATYATENAFEATQAAGNQSNGVTFINSEGAAVYYNKDTPTNVYVAYPNQSYQIEVFNPMAKTALDIASIKGALRLVK